MRSILSFACTALTLAVLVMTLEFLIPAGPVKKTASAAAGLVYLAAVCDQIFGIIARMGV